MPTIMATVDRATRSTSRMRVPDVHALHADPAEDGERPIDIGDAGYVELLARWRVRSPQRHDEARGARRTGRTSGRRNCASKILLVGRVRIKTSFHVSAKSSTNVVKGTTSAYREERAFEPK